MRSLRKVRKGSGEYLCVTGFQRGGIGESGNVQRQELFQPKFMEEGKGECVRWDHPDRLGLLS